MNEPAPRSAITYGGSYRWKKIYPETEVPDVVQTLFEYSNFTYNVSLTLNSSSQGFGAYFMGTKGTVQVSETELAFYPDEPLDDYGWVVAAWPDKMQQEFVKANNIVGINQPWSPGTCRTPETNEHYNIIGDPTDLHVKAFVECVRHAEAQQGKRGRRPQRRAGRAPRQHLLPEWQPESDVGRQKGDGRLAISSAIE